MHPKVSNGKQYHIACRKGDLAEYLLVPGDPERVPKIAKLWDTAKEVSCHREFRSFTGKYKSVPISATCQVVSVQLAWLSLLTRLHV